MSRGTFYNHYKNVEEVLSDLGDSFVEKMGKAFSDMDVSSEEGVKKFYERLEDVLSQEKDTVMSIGPYLPIRSYLRLRDKLNDTIEKHRSSFLGPGEGEPDEAYLNKVRFFVSGVLGSCVDSIVRGRLSIHDVCLLSYETSALMFTPEGKKK